MQKNDSFFVLAWLFLTVEGDVTTYLADGVGMDVKERCDVLQVEVLHDARATLHEQVVALAGSGAVEVEIARTELAKGKVSQRHKAV